MHYTRLEMRLLPRGWSRGALYEYAIAGIVLGVGFDVASGTVSHTLVGKGRRAPKVEGAAPVGDASTPLPKGVVRLTRGMRVLASGATLGLVTRVWCDRTTAKVTHLVMRDIGGVLGRKPERVVAIALVERLDESDIHLCKGVVTVADLPLLRDDATILQDVRVALAERIPDPRARRDIKVRCEDGQVTMVGWVELEEEVEAARDAVRSVPGVRDVTFDLLPQDTLGDTVDQTVSEFVAQRGWAGARVYVLAEHGIIFLEGSAPTTEARTEIERLVLRIPGVRLVANNIAVGGEPPSRGNGTGPLVRSR